MTMPPEKAALSRELADFLIELSIAVHKHAMYPEGHPSLAPAAAGVTRRAERLFEERTTLALGVARQQLVIEGVATDAKNPLLSELAGRLHRHHLGAVTFDRGLRVTEVADVVAMRSEEHTSELQSRPHLVCRLLLEKKKKTATILSPVTCNTASDYTSY